MKKGALPPFKPREKEKVLAAASLTLLSNPDKKKEFSRRLRYNTPFEP